MILFIVACEYPSADPYSRIIISSFSFSLCFECTHCISASLLPSSLSGWRDLLLESWICFLENTTIATKGRSPWQYAVCCASLSTSPWWRRSVTWRLMFWVNIIIKVAAKRSPEKSGTRKSHYFNWVLNWLIHWPRCVCLSAGRDVCLPVVWLLLGQWNDSVVASILGMHSSCLGLRYAAHTHMHFCTCAVYCGYGMVSHTIFC